MESNDNSEVQNSCLLSDEAFGYAIIEYMTSSCAVIASNVGGISEIITHKVNGLLVDSADIHDLENAICLLITETQLQQQFAREGHNSVQQWFDAEKIFPQIEAEIRRTLLTSG